MPPNRCQLHPPHRAHNAFSPPAQTQQRPRNSPMLHNNPTQCRNPNMSAHFMGCPRLPPLQICSSRPITSAAPARGSLRTFIGTVPA